MLWKSKSIHKTILNVDLCVYERETKAMIPSSHTCMILKFDFGFRLWRGEGWPVYMFVCAGSEYKHASMYGMHIIVLHTLCLVRHLYIDNSI